MAGRSILWLTLFYVALTRVSEAGYILNGSGLSGGARWDASARTIAGNERSLQAGLRYSISGGSYEAFRDRFSWIVTPSAFAFQQAVEQAFAAWSAPDPGSQFGTPLYFVPDFGTQVASGSAFGSLDQNGAEIDLIASDAGSAGLGGLTTVSIFATPVTLTSGTTNYSNSSALAGVDVHINDNPGALYTLEAFRRVLTHELGHAIGLNDVDLGAPFIDDNFSLGSPVATLTNSWIELVNPLDPANSPGLSLYNIPSGVFATPGVDLLMESNGLGIGASNPLSNPNPLTNDEYGMRQFLYPSIASVPEPCQLGLAAVLLSLVAGARKRAKSVSARFQPHFAR